MVPGPWETDGPVPELQGRTTLRFHPGCAEGQLRPPPSSAGAQAFALDGGPRCRAGRPSHMLLSGLGRTVNTEFQGAVSVLIFFTYR